MYTDPSAASNPEFEYVIADGGIPITGDGSPLAKHGIYGTGTTFTQWGIGNMNLTDSPINDFTGGVDLSTAAAGKFGQINAYNVSITGFTQVHFDALARNQIRH